MTGQQQLSRELSQDATVQQLNAVGDVVSKDLCKDLSQVRIC